MYQWDGPSAWEFLVLVGLMAFVYLALPVVAGIWAGTRAPGTMTISRTRAVKVGLVVGVAGILANVTWLMWEHKFVPSWFLEPVIAIARHIPIPYLTDDMAITLAGPLTVAVLVVLATRWVSGIVAQRTRGYWNQTR